MLMDSIFEALLPTFSVMIMICILFYIFAILFTEMIGHSAQFEGDSYIHEHFGTVGNSLVTLLQLLTLDSWTATCRYVQHNADTMAYVLLLWGMYVLFILLGPLMMLNCLNAIFVEGVITKITHKKLEKAMADTAEKKALAEKLKDIFTTLDKSGNGSISALELDDAITHTTVLTDIKKLGLKRHDLEAMFTSCDKNGDGHINNAEFIEGFSNLLNIPMDPKDVVALTASKISASEDKPRREMEAKLSALDSKISAIMEKLDILHEQQCLASATARRPPPLNVQRPAAVSP